MSQTADSSSSPKCFTISGVSPVEMMMMLMTATTTMTLFPSLGGLALMDTEHNIGQLAYHHEIFNEHA